MSFWFWYHIRMEFPRPFLLLSPQQCSFICFLKINVDLSMSGVSFGSRDSGDLNIQNSLPSWSLYSGKLQEHRFRAFRRGKRILRYRFLHPSVGRRSCRWSHFCHSKRYGWSHVGRCHHLLRSAVAGVRSWIEHDLERIVCNCSWCSLEYTGVLQPLGNVMVWFCL